MMEGAFYQQKNASPTAITIVVLMHGAALTALAMAKGEVLQKVITRTITYDVPEDKPPPEVPPKPIEDAATPPVESVITHVPPIIEMPPQPQFTRTDPLPETQDIVIAQPDPTPLPKADPAPPPVRTVEPARAKANLASYVSDEDYPSSAARNEEQGTTRFRLLVGANGRVTDCKITASSGSSALDSTTCRLMKQRARFTPARNSRDEPTGDTYASAIRWQLPAD